MSRKAIGLILAASLLLGGAAAAYGRLTNLDLNQDATWSIVAFDPQTGELGVVVQTCRPAVGNRCPWAEAGVGAVSTQASTNPLLATRVLGLLASGYTAQEALDAAINEDTGKQNRQIIVCDHTGGVAAWTGTGPSEYKGQILGENFAAAGNILAGESVLTATAAAFQSSTATSLAYRLLDAMEAGQAEGGDQRGTWSMALKVVRPGWFPFIDLRVDNNKNADPFGAMRTLLDVWMVEGGANNPNRAPNLGFRPVRNGDVGVDVSHIQVMLRDLGYYNGDITGVFHGQTNAAVRQLQKNEGLKPDGTVFGETLTALVAAWLALW